MLDNCDEKKDSICKRLHFKKFSFGRPIKGSLVGLAQRKNYRRGVVGFATILLLLVFWYLATTLTGWINPSRFPRPDEVLSAFTFIQTEGYGNGKLHQHVLHSLKLVAMGFAFAVSFGVPLGLLMGYSRRAETLINPAFLLLRPIPPLAWIPLAIVWLGLEDGSKILVIFVAAFVPSVINSYTGVRNIDTPVMEAASMLGIKGWRMVAEVLVPGAMPMIFTGLRLSLQASWTTLVAAELIGALYGLGSILNQAAQDIFPAMILLAMVLVGICGASTTWVLGALENHAMPWRKGRVAT
jgi:NitT/TauT family transport system permease protein/taurine transport system permease protein